MQNFLGDSRFGQLVNKFPALVELNRLELYYGSPRWKSIMSTESKSRPHILFV
jgi:hypothetical protein